MRPSGEAGALVAPRGSPVIPGKRCGAAETPRRRVKEVET